MKIIKLFCGTALLYGLLVVSLAEGAQRTASIAEIKGIAEVKIIAQKNWVPAKLGMQLRQGDTIRTKENSWVVINVDGAAQTATVELKPNSQLKLAELLQNKTDASQATLLDLSLGEILIEAKKLHSEKSKFEVKTPTSIIGVRGTTFSVTVKAIE